MLMHCMSYDIGGLGVVLLTVIRFTQVGLYDSFSKTVGHVGRTPESLQNAECALVSLAFVVVK
jgi:hypothetical protein